VLGNLVLPGLGTWASGRRMAGITQIVASQAGFILMMSWGIWFVAAWIHTHEFPTELGPILWLIVPGAVMFFGAWLWALVSSLQILRAARTTSA
jgi:hypothetical protein